MSYFRDLTKEEIKLFKKFNSPRKIQDFLNSIPANFEKGGETLMSPRRVLKENKAHCMEGALLAAAILWFQGEKPLLMDLKTNDNDFDHVVALFRRDESGQKAGTKTKSALGRWGAISKTNHGVLRFREPVYASPRELAMSYFHEYFLDNGAKTLRSYSAPFDVAKTKKPWLTAEKDLWEISELLDNSPHYAILDKTMIASLRRADPIEIKVGKLTEWNDEGSSLVS